MAALVYRAHHIRKTLGLRSAAGFLRNREVTFAEAYFVLLGRVPRKV